MAGEKHSRVSWWLAGGFAIVLIGGCGMFLHALLQVHYVLAEFDCGQGRKIVIYADTFCDQADIPLFEVWDQDAIVSTKFVTMSGFPCNAIMTAKDLKLVTCEDGNLVAVLDLRESESDPILIHDFTSGKTWPSFDENSEEEYELKRRLIAAGYSLPAPPAPRPWLDPDSRFTAPDER